VPDINVAKLHASQAEVFCDPHRFKVVTAGRRWGKTALSKVTIIRKAAMNKKMKVWYVAPSYSMAKNIMWDELKESIPRDWIKPKGINETDLSIKLINGSVIECKGADNPDSLRGVGLNYVVLDEFQDMKPDTWVRVLRPTLAKDRGHALFIGTPKGYQNLYDLHKLGQGDNPMWKSWQFPTITSPFIPPSEIEDARRDMDAKSFAQEFLASFESMSGQVYHAFDRDVHIGDYPFNPDLPIWIGSDFNIDPMSTIIMQPQKNGEIWLVDEISIRNSNTAEVCNEIERRYWRHMDETSSQITIYPDPAGGARQHARGESDLDIYREKGLRRQKYRRKHPMISDRVNAVNKMLMDAAGNVRLRVDSKCKEAIMSFDQTLYREGTRDIDKRPGTEHMTDAIGYAIELEFPSRQVVIAGASL